VDVKVYANSDDTLVVWKIDQRIDGLRGFAVYRRDLETMHEDVLLNSVGWGENDTAPQRPSTERPLQRFMWTDYKARDGQRLSYRVVPLTGTPGHLRPVTTLASEWTDEITLKPDGEGGIAAYFNRGIVASQWLSRRLGPGPAKVQQRKLAAIIDDPSDLTRQFLAGELRSHMLRLLGEAHTARLEIHAALYELDDPELLEALCKLGPLAKVILANGSTKKKTTDPNKDARDALNEAHVEVHDRMTAPGHLAHNKFVVISDAQGGPARVWTGSTNWSKTGLCTQANNGILFNSAGLAAKYLEQWKQLRDAGSGYPRAELAHANNVSTPVKVGGHSVKVWFTPVDDEADLDEVRDLIKAAKHGILFIMFNPGPSGTLLNAIIDRKDDPDLVVRGVVNQDPSSSKTPVLIFRRKEVLRGSFQVALPAAIDKRVSYWIPELKKKQGAWAMVHSKTIVIDPFAKESEPIVVTGSHNLGPKASRANDDNLVIVRGDRALAAAYAVNIEAIYASYRWRYNRMYSKQARAFTKLEDDDTWQDGHLRGPALQELNFWLGA